MKTLKKFEFTSRSPLAKYDWDTLLNGKIYELESGVDYQCDTNLFRVMAQRTGRTRGLDVKMQTVDSGLVIQAVPGTEEQIADWAAKEAAAKARVKERKAAAKATVNGQEE